MIFTTNHQENLVNSPKSSTFAVNLSLKVKLISSAAIARKLSIQNNIWKIIFNFLSKRTSSDARPLLVLMFLQFLIYPGYSWFLLSNSAFTYRLITFATKTMDQKHIEAILENGSDEFFERFYETLQDEIFNDDEPYYKKARQLLLAAIKNENADDFFIAICGYSLESLLERL